MEYTLVIMVLVCIVVGYLALSQISSLSQYALLITIAATLLTASSLTYSTGKMVIYTTAVGSAELLSPGTVQRVCGEKDSANTLCYKEVEYKGFPFRMMTVEYPPHGRPITSVSQSGSRPGSGIFMNYLLYLTLVSLIVAVIQKARKRA